VRTLCDRAPRFNPMSYHDGSVWPHDSGICAAGIARYGDRAGIRHLIDEIFGAAHHFGMRLPELFCGFARAAGEPPVGYPVACLPQAWSSGAIFMMLQAALGLSVDAWQGEVRIDRPELPSEVERLLVHDLVVAGQPVDLCFQRVGDRVTASLARSIPDAVHVTVRV
jgi:glycogen debranching enzyme